MKWVIFWQGMFSPLSCKMPLPTRDEPDGSRTTAEPSTIFQQDDRHHRHRPSDRGLGRESVVEKHYISEHLHTDAIKCQNLTFAPSYSTVMDSSVLTSKSNPPPGPSAGFVPHAYSRESKKTGVQAKIIQDKNWNRHPEVQVVTKKLGNEIGKTGDDDHCATQPL